MGLALVAISKGYKCIFTTTDKQSKEKMDILKAVGAEVIVCPTNVAADDPRSYYSVAELWKQTEGKITHLIVGVGTGGTISGTGKYLKEQNPNIQIIGVDTYGSALKKYHETGEFDDDEVYPYITEGIGEDIIPANIDFDIIDEFIKVTDKDGAIYTRRLAREEGMFIGNSCGSAMAGCIQLKDRFKPEDLVVLIFHDHGSRR